MHIEQSELLRDVGRDFLMDFMEVPVKEEHQDGDFLFQEGDKARYFYILVNGHVKLSIGDTGHLVHTIDHAGDVFGWSSLVGLEAYSASAECRKPTQALKFDVQKLQKVFDAYPASAYLFFKRLAGIVGNRLIQSYKTIAGGFQPEIQTSFGSRQVSEIIPES